MVEYSKISCKLTNVQLNKLKKAVKSNQGTILKVGIKNFNKDELAINNNNMKMLLIIIWQLI